MPLIVVVEDDEGTRKLLRSVLEVDGYEVKTADDGLAGLAVIRAGMPDLVVSDVQMPKMDGFQMVAAMRADAQLTSIPVVLLTSLQERAHMRIGMTSGADDYLTKPVRPMELKEAVAAQIHKSLRLAELRSMEVGLAVQTALQEQQKQISKLYERRLARTLSAPWQDDKIEKEQKVTTATVLFADIANYASWAERLSSSELADLVQLFYRNAGDTVYLFGADPMLFVGEGLLCIFTVEQDTQTVNHGLRAAKAAFGLLEARKRMQQFVQTKYSNRGLPEFNVVIAMHSGPVTLARLEGMLGQDEPPVPVGDTVTSTIALQRKAMQKELQVLATVQTMRLVMGAIKPGLRFLVPIEGRSAALDAIEILGLQTS